MITMECWGRAKGNKNLKKILKTFPKITVVRFCFFFFFKSQKHRNSTTLKFQIHEINDFTFSTTVILKLGRQSRYLETIYAFGQKSKHPEMQSTMPHRQSTQLETVYTTRQWRTRHTVDSQSSFINTQFIILGPTMSANVATHCRYFIFEICKQTVSHQVSGFFL